VYPALTVLQRLAVDHPDVEILWIGSEDGMEADLVMKAKVPFETISAAGVHGVGWRRLPGNMISLLRGIGAARKVIKRYKPDLLFFTGGYVAAPMAVAGINIPTILYVPDIEPGLALKFLSWFADQIAVTTEDSRQYFPGGKKIRVTGYPTRPELSAWGKSEAYQAFDLLSELPTLLVTGGSLGSLSINESLVAVLPELLKEMQVIHVTGNLTWPQFERVREGLAPEQAARYRAYPYLHQKMGAAFTIADLVFSRAGSISPALSVNPAIAMVSKLTTVFIFLSFFKI